MEIKILPANEHRIVKQVTIVSELQGQDIAIGHILYERTFSNKYKFKDVPRENRDFFYYLDYPGQNIYPNDSVDDLILQSVRNTFPKSTSRGHSVICDTDKQRIEHLKNREWKSSEITFIPDFSHIDVYNLNGSYAGLRKPIKVYYDFNKKDNDLYFSGYYDLRDPGILNKVESISFI